MAAETGSATITVLVATADEEYADRITTNLTGHGDYAVTVARTVGEAMERFTAGEDVDCIVSDHDLPDVDGIAFLQTVRAQDPDFPFLLMTAEGSENVASRAISAGVTDYLIKDEDSPRWKRLARLVEDAVTYYHNHADLIDTEQRARHLLDAAHDTIAIVRDGRFEHVNQSGLDLLGAETPSEIAQESVDGFFDFQEASSSAELIERVEAGAVTVERHEGTVHALDGRTVPVELTVSPVQWTQVPAAVVIVRDVSDRVTRTRELRRLRKAVDAAGQAIFITDPDGTIQYANPAFEAITGYTPEEAVGRDANILKSGEMPEEHYEELWSTISDGENWEEEIINRRRDGEHYYAYQTIAPITDDEGGIEGHVAVQADITDRKELEADLRRYEEVVELLEDPIMLQDEEGRFELVNPAVCEYAGVDRETLLGRDEFAFMDEETAATIDERKAEVLDTEQPVSYEVTPTFERGDRDETAFKTSRYPYYENGECVGTIAICRDVTALKRKQETLQQFKLAVEGAYDLIAASDTEGKLLFANEPYCEYHGVDPAEAPGMPVEDVIGEEYETVKRFIDTALDGEPVQYRMDRIHPQFGNRILDIRYYPLEDDAGNPRGIVSILRDVTERAERERQLRVVDRVLRHNLRNDLTVIRGLAEASKVDVDASIAADLQTIVDRCDGLLTTARKSRAITTTLRGTSSVESVDLSTLVRSVAESAAESYPESTITADVPDSAPATVETNIRQAVEELVTNAVVHHDGDEPTVEVAVEVDSETVDLIVTDDGPGISGMDRQILTSGAETDDLYHGSGLGLWLIYWLVQRSGGSIAVSDADPRGTVIRMTFPRATEPTTEDTPIPSGESR